jgi:high affinity Mn2+ porin
VALHAPHLASRRRGRHKSGCGLNFEQEVNSPGSFFGRLGWSDGGNESFTYTQVVGTLQLSGFAKGSAWRHRNGRTGAVFVANGIVAAHQQHLALGDGGLHYGLEKTVEGFYAAHPWRVFYASFDLQHNNNPGYNQDRAPVVVPGLCLHVDL